MRFILNKALREVFLISSRIFGHHRDRKQFVNSKEETQNSSLNASEHVLSANHTGLSEASENAHSPGSTFNLEKLNLPKIISFDSIARCGDEVWIESDGKIYRLRKTKQGKLILTK